jgi:hypothetical protein
VRPPERDGAELDELANAWASADDSDTGPRVARGSDADDRIWRAVAGELPPDELRALAALAASDPGVAQAWRLARELRAGEEEHGSEAGAPPLGRRWTPARAWALAAALVLGLGLLFWLPDVRSGDRAPEPTLRSGDTALRIEPALADGASLSRASFRLRWIPLTDPATRYTLRLSTAELTVVAELVDLAVPEVTVPPESLAPWPAGTKLYWQVEARGPDGRVRQSPLSRVVLVD